jgi:membrane peptidoglycan carboxypeptidase
VGSAAPAGRASVRPSGGYGGDQGSTGRAGVRGAVGSAAVGGASVGAPAGRATVGRASVRPDGSPVPGGPGGPGGPGSGGPGAGRGNGSGGKKPRTKKTRRRNIILSAFALFIMLSGVLVVGGTYYFDQVKMPGQLPTPNQSTTIYYADGTTPMAKLGDQNRTMIPLSQVPKDVQHAVVSAEDGSFYTNSGVDFKGVLRAAWNNVTGGNRQGASTITQQYARTMADLEGISYARKLREAVIAMKLDQDYSKDQILEAYLNTVYFGRGAYGIEAAAQAYFGPTKHAANLTLAEGMVLASSIKQPEPDPTDPKGSPGYDPNNSLSNATDRWNYVKTQLVKLKFVQAADADKLIYPTTWVKPTTASTSAAQYGLDSPTGFVVHHVMDELSHGQGFGDEHPAGQPGGRAGRHRARYRACARLLRR